MLASIRNNATSIGLVCLLSAACVSAKGALGIKAAKVSITSADGINDATYTLKEPTPLPSPITLSETSVFKLSFSVVDIESGEGVFPQQAHLRFEDPQGDDVTLPVTVKSNGKAQITINAAKLHRALLPTRGHFQLTLLLSSLDEYTPLAYPLGRLSLPPSVLESLPRKRHDLPARAGEPAFQPEQELYHTFKEDPKTVGWFKSGTGVIVTLMPWGVLLTLIPKLSPSLRFQSPPVSSYIFLLVLAALETLIFVYWVGLKLYQLLPPFLALSAIAAYTGLIALRELRARRLKAGGSP
nr:oligosaccharyltransferase complex subunit delta (ribophorin II) [Cryptococcus depauperatus CBS 7841]